MGNATAPLHANVIPVKSIREIVPESMAGFVSYLKKCGVPLDDAARAIRHDDWGDLPDACDDTVPERIGTLWSEVEEAFKEATTVGKSRLHLDIDYYDPDEGDEYDELEGGAFFSVEGTHQLSPAGEKFKDHFEEKSWTWFG